MVDKNFADPIPIQFRSSWHQIGCSRNDCISVDGPRLAIFVLNFYIESVTSTVFDNLKILKYLIF
jgi:hypothetical protein